MPVFSGASSNEAKAAPAKTEELDRYISQIANNDKKALVELYRATSTPIYSFALSILKNRHDAEDVLQDCYLAISSAAGSYRPQGKPLAWILTITRNLCRMKLREHERTSTLPAEDWASFPGSNTVSPEEKLILTECMAGLSDEERQIVVLHVVAGLKHREIAKIYGMPLPTVLSKHSRALKKLKKMMMEGER